MSISSSDGFTKCAHGVYGLMPTACGMCLDGAYNARGREIERLRAQLDMLRNPEKIHELLSSLFHEEYYRDGDAMADELRKVQRWLASGLKTGQNGE